MKKLIILFLCLSASIVFLAHYFISSLEKEDQKYKVKIGNKFILDKDTTIIIDYNKYEEVFILSNGKRINYNLVK